MNKKQFNSDWMSELKSDLERVGDNLAELVGDENEIVRVLACLGAAFIFLESIEDKELKETVFTAIIDKFEEESQKYARIAN